MSVCVSLMLLCFMFIFFFFRFRHGGWRLNRWLTISIGRYLFDSSLRLHLTIKKKTNRRGRVWQRAVLSRYFWSSGVSFSNLSEMSHWSRKKMLWTLSHQWIVVTSSSDHKRLSTRIKRRLCICVGMRESMECTLHIYIWWNGKTDHRQLFTDWIWSFLVI